ncbi:hypothetical protein AWV80_05810 [Cupriavidus sp. UYMU48A]|nr:hypothetical protein AWV80_05810 [Cupriavidus sp. UYMU48A]
MNPKVTSVLKLTAAQVAAGSLCASATWWLLRPSISLLDTILYVAGFTVAGLATVQLFRRRRLPESLRRVLVKMHAAALREASAKGLMRGASRFVGAYPTLFASVILVMLLHHYAPAVEKLPEGARWVYNAATAVGILALGRGALWGIFGASESVVAFGVTFIWRLVLLALGLVLVRVSEQMWPRRWPG